MSLPPASAPIRIDPAAVYTVAAVVLTLDVPSATILAAIRAGHLPAVRRGRRHYIAGADLLRWLTPPAPMATQPKGGDRG
jgi:excisionase family DNA binding protein